MGLPQIIYLGLVMLGLGMALAKHGEPKHEDWNFFTSLLSTAITIFLLYWGGFFG